MNKELTKEECLNALKTIEDGTTEIEDYESFPYVTSNQFAQEISVLKRLINEHFELKEKVTPKKPITDGSTYLPSCNKVQYICPHCKQIMLRTICIKAHKPNYCYKCGGALDWSEDDENS